MISNDGFLHSGIICKAVSVVIPILSVLTHIWDPKVLACLLLESPFVVSWPVTLGDMIWSDWDDAFPHEKGEKRPTLCRFGFLAYGVSGGERVFVLAGSQRCHFLGVVLTFLGWQWCFCKLFLLSWHQHAPSCMTKSHPKAKGLISWLVAFFVYQMIGMLMFLFEVCVPKLTSIICVGCWHVHPLCCVTIGFPHLENNPTNPSNGKWRKYNSFIILKYISLDGKMYTVRRLSKRLRRFILTNVYVISTSAYHLVIILDIANFSGTGRFDFSFCFSIGIFHLGSHTGGVATWAGIPTKLALWLERSNNIRPGYLKFI